MDDRSYSPIIHSIFMNILLTLGPTQEPLDAMRIISNRSTGHLGAQLALKFLESGYHVVALRGTGATAPIDSFLEKGGRILPFTTTEDLRMLLEQIARQERVDAVFHLAAVSDFFFPAGGRGKIPTGDGPLTLTLETTPKLLPMMKRWFPKALIIGWKFEASSDGPSGDHGIRNLHAVSNKKNALKAASAQISGCDSHACVLNGPSYGSGFGVLEKAGTLTHLDDRNALCDFLVHLVKDRESEAQ